MASSPAFMVRSASAGLTTTTTPVVASASPKPILKRASRPTPLPLPPSPFPFSTRFNITLSLSASPSSSSSHHVHFPPSPLLHSTLAICSPRGGGGVPSPLTSIAFSPYAVVTPLSADSLLSSLSLFSPFRSGGFKVLEPPKPAAIVKPAIKVDNSNTNNGQKVKPKPKRTVRFTDPRSPRGPSAGTMSLSAVALKIGNVGTLPRTELGKALTNFPRSPYPSAPLSSTERDLGQATTVMKRRNSADNAILSKPRRALNNNNTNNNNTSITFKLTSSRRLAPPHLDLGGVPFDVLEDVKEEEQEEDISDVSSASAESARLSNAFWQSVSLEEGILESGRGSGSLAEFPESVSEGSSPALSRSSSPAAQPTATTAPVRMSMLFGKSDGALWSPGPVLLQDPPMASPRGVIKFEPPLLKIKRSTFTAPSPKDPLAKFPSFATTIGMVDFAANGVLKPPPRAHLA